MHRITLLFAFLFTFQIGTSQDYPQDYFRSPLDIPLFLSGNFGELRSNHFHAGLDIKTQGVEGKKVFAIADGYVSRIKVSPYGYGNALYITHPNGYTSVYGHLKKYSDKIAKVVKAEQYRKEQFSVQLFPPPYQLQVKKGEVIAYTGNTGGSGGPHLHFEIRDTETEHPINPLYFGFELQDNLAPDIYAVTLYPLNDTSFINGSNRAKRFTASGRNGQYRLQSSASILVHGELGFGIESVDRMNGTGNRYGLHKLSLQVDQETVFEKQMDEFAFHEGRYINAYIDYATYIKSRRRVQRCYTLAGNRLRCYPKLKNDGKLIFNDNQAHEIEFAVSDFDGNTSKLSFKVEAKATTPPKKESSIGAKKVKFFNRKERNTFIRDNILLDLPRGILYEDLYFEYRKEAPLRNTVSPVYWLHNHYTPLHSYMTVSIKAPNLTEKQKEKALIVSTTNGRSLYAEGGKWKGDNISVKTRSFGGYAIALDSVAPKIIPINIYPGANMSGKWSISVKISDNLSGIDSFRAEIDGKWILMEYDAKRNMLYHYFDESTTSGQHEFKLSVVDGVGNRIEYKASFRR
ncbi:MAG: M23 family metallopeptidase [Vicingaceae bacterium]